MDSQIPDGRFISSIFLPNILLGDYPDPPIPPAISEIPPRSIPTPGSFESTANVMKCNCLHKKLFDKSLTKISIPSSFFVHEKAGPPKIGLFDTRKPAAYLGVDEPTTFNKDIPILLPKKSLNARKYLSYYRIEKNNSYWVTVFGFPSSMLNIVLALLATCGTITQKKHPQGNWVHIRFSNFEEVSKAVSLNGKLIIDNVMIAVQLHYPRETKKNMVTLSPKKARSPRPLTLLPLERDNNVIPKPNMPHKCTDLVNKTIDYVFGW